MPRKRLKKAKKTTKPRKTKPRLLSGDNPQIAKGYGDAPVKAYIAATPGWKQEVAKRVDALIVPPSIFFNDQRRTIVALAARARLPAIYFDRRFVDAGGFLFYGAGLAAMYRHAAGHGGRILRGAKPGELPVGQPTTFELVVNLKAANALGLAVPEALLLRADEVIE